MLFSSLSRPQRALCAQRVKFVTDPSPALLAPRIGEKASQQRGAAGAEATG